MFETIVSIALPLLVCLFAAFKSGYWRMLNEFTQNNYANVFEGFPLSVFQHDNSQIWKWKDGSSASGEAFKNSSTILSYKTDFNHYTWLWYKRWLGVFITAFALLVYFSHWGVAAVGYFLWVIVDGYSYERTQKIARTTSVELKPVFREYLKKWEDWNKDHVLFEGYRDSESDRV